MYTSQSIIQNRMANDVDPDEMAHYEPSHLDLPCLHKYLFLSIGLKGLTPYHTCLKIRTSQFNHMLTCLKTAGCMTNSVGPDQMLHSAASDLGLPCLFRSVCPNTQSHYSTLVLQHNAR